MYLVCVHCTQGDTGLIAVEVDGRKENPLITALGDNWRRRRHIMTPAFSTHKMRLVRWEVDTDVNEFANHGHGSTLQFCRMHCLLGAVLFGGMSN